MLDDARVDAIIAKTLKSVPSSHSRRIYATSPWSRELRGSWLALLGSALYAVLVHRLM